MQVMAEDASTERLVCRIKVLTRCMFTQSARRRRSVASNSGGTSSELNAVKVGGADDWRDAMKTGAACALFVGATGLFYA